MARPNVVKLVGVDSKNGEIIAVYISHELSGYKGKFVPDRPHGEWLQQYKNDGKWHDMGYFDHMYKCSKCGSNGSQRWHFCPNCGADMREGDEK